MSTARQDAMAAIANQTQYAATRKQQDVTQATQFYPSNNPNNVENPYNTIAPPPPPGSAEPTIPNDLDITEENNRVIDFARLYGKTSAFFQRMRRNLRANALRANRRIGGIPTPGGIAVPLGLLLFFWLILIPVNGHTRLRWLWNSFFGFSALSHTETTGGNIIKNDTSTQFTFTTDQSATGGSVNTQPVPIQTIIWQQPGNSYLYTLESEQ